MSPVLLKDLPMGDTATAKMCYRGPTSVFTSNTSLSDSATGTMGADSIVMGIVGLSKSLKVF